MSPRGGKENVYTIVPAFVAISRCDRPLPKQDDGDTEASCLRCGRTVADEPKAAT